VLALISLGFSLYLSWHLLGGLPSRMIAGNTADIRLFTWYLENDSVSVLHGRDPLLFTTMNAPAGVNGMWNTSILLPALVMTPVTLLAGPLAAYNVLFVLGLASGPLCTFPLLRRFTSSRVAAGLGALVFGFSPAVIAAGLGHINLVLTGLMPITLLLALDLVSGRRDPLNGGAALGLAAAGLLFTSEELLFQTALVVVVAGVLVQVTQPRIVTVAALRRVARGSLVALGVFLLICAWPLWLQFWGPLHQHGSPFTLSFFEADLRGFYVPPRLLWLTTPGSSAFAASYGGGAPEYLAYLGIPLLIVAPLTGLARITDPRARVLLGTGAVFALFSLGGTLLYNGHQTGVRLPWGAVEGWPVFGSALPDRFAVVVALAAAACWPWRSTGSCGPGGRPRGPARCCWRAPAWCRCCPGPTPRRARRPSRRSSPRPAGGCRPARPSSSCRIRPARRPCRWPGRPRRTWRSGCPAATSSDRRRAGRPMSAGPAPRPWPPR